MRRLTQEEFIRRAIAVHGEGRYDYSQVVYHKIDEKVIIKCNVCGRVFKQTPGSHLQGGGCNELHLRKTTEEIVKEAKLVHGDKYDYTRVEYRGMTKPVTIICHKHGPFQQDPGHHIRLRQGCPICGRERQIAAMVGNTEDFVKQSKMIHGDAFDYGLVEYKNNTIPVLIKCNKCQAVFPRSPHVHLEGYDCPKCGKSAPMGTEEFIRRSKELFGDKYGYQKVEYVNLSTPVTLVCPKHGDFEVIPANHLTRMDSCRKCSASKGETKIIRFLDRHGIPYTYPIKSDYAPGTKKTFYVDFYLEQKNLIIEYNGDQHYRKRDEWGGEEQLDWQKRRDEGLREHCEREQVDLLEIPYTDFRHIDEILKKRLL